MPATTPMTMKRIQREISDIKKEDLGSIVLEPTDNLQVWRGVIPGPEGSVYEGGVFQVEIVLPNDYPFTAPRVVFKTRIYHMNISEHGGICIDILKNNWSPALSLFKVMLSLSSLLTDPNPKDPLVAAVATQYVRNRNLHDATARQWTELYARAPETKPVPKSQLSTPLVPVSESIVTTPPIPVLSSAHDHNNQSLSSVSRGSRRRGDHVAGPSTFSLPSSAGSTATDEVIVLDSDDEGASSSRARKRKRKADESTNDVLNLSDSEEEADRRKSVDKKPRTRSRPFINGAPGSSETSRNPRSLGRPSDVIIIDD